MYCRKCNLEFESNKNSCPRCGATIQKIEKTTNGLPLSKELICSIIWSIFVFILTIIISFSLHIEIDSTPSALSHHYVMAVPNNSKPFIIGISVILILISTIKTIIFSKMNIKEKAVAFLVDFCSVLSSICMVNFCLEI